MHMVLLMMPQMHMDLLMMTLVHVVLQYRPYAFVLS
jgi:hypothetical protein